jgi:hypothetical protein
LEAEAFAFGFPRIMGQKKETFHVLLSPTYMLSGIASGVVFSPVVEPLEHVVRLLATPETETCDAVGGAFRPEWRSGHVANFRIRSETSSEHLPPCPSWWATSVAQSILQILTLVFQLAKFFLLSFNRSSVIVAVSTRHPFLHGPARRGSLSADAAVVGARRVGSSVDGGARRRAQVPRSHWNSRRRKNIPFDALWLDNRRALSFD